MMTFLPLIDMPPLPEITTPVRPLHPVQLALFPDLQPVSAPGREFLSDDSTTGEIGDDKKEKPAASTMLAQQLSLFPVEPSQDEEGA